MTAPTPEEIEAVARAICVAGHDDWNREGVGGIDAYRDMATAAIQALRSLAPPGEDVAGLIAEARRLSRECAFRMTMAEPEGESERVFGLAAEHFTRLANALDNQHP